MVFNVTFNNFSVISWRSVLLVEETHSLLETFTMKDTWFFTKFIHFIVGFISNLRDILLQHSILQSVLNLT